MREPFPHTRLKLRELLGLEAKFTRLNRWETLRKIVHENYSLSRYGDGELRYFLKKRSLYFQPYYANLGERLHQAIMEPKDSLLTCFSNELLQMDRYVFIQPEAILAGRNRGGDSPYWLGDDRRRQRRTYIERWIRVARRTKIRTFGDSNCFRIDGYVAEFENHNLEEVKEDFRALFSGRRILFICPNNPHGGESFQTLEPKLRAIGLKDAQYIAIPQEDVASIEHDVRREIDKKRGYDDIFIQAGPLATVLAYELAGTIEGRVIDSGRLNKTVVFL